MGVIVSITAFEPRASPAISLTITLPFSEVPVGILD